MRLVATVLILPMALSSCAGLEVANSYSEKAKTLVVRSNMKKVQLAAEKYFGEHSYRYPTAIDDDFKSYFKASDDEGNESSNSLTNPFTGTEEWPVLGSVTDLEAARQQQPEALKRGTLEYSPIEGGKSYAIRGGAENDLAIADEEKGTTLVLSRDDFDRSTLQK